jgi:3-oxoacid CoA-transferase subunit B
VGCVKRIITDLGMFEVTPEGFRLTERAPGVGVEEIKAKTEGRLIAEEDVREMAL